MLRPLVQNHLNEHIPRIQTLRHRNPLSVANLEDFLRRNQALPDLLRFTLTRLLFNPALYEPLDLIFVPGIALNRVPASTCHGVSHQAPKSPMINPTIQPENLSIIQITKEITMVNITTTMVALRS